MLHRHLLWLWLSCLGAGCVEAVTVGDARDPDNQRADSALASLALELQGEWYGRVPTGTSDMPIKMTLEATDAPRAVAFRVECTTSDCPLAQWLASIAELRGGVGEYSESDVRDAATREPIADDAEELPSGVYQLLALLDDVSGVAARCVLLPDGQGPAIQASLWLSADRTELRFAGALEGRSLYLTRDP